MGSDKTLTLYELNSLVRQVIETTMDREYWVEAELSECRESRGHCYMELVQKEETGFGRSLTNTPIARASAKCWRNTWTIIAPYFEKTTGQPLHAGLKVRIKVYAQFHEAYGFSWIVTDIDPNFTMGDMARRRQEIIQKLREEGIFDMQKELSLPAFALRIAVVSSPSAAGYGDFLGQLADSPYAFEVRLFTATMQGEAVEESIIGALNEIYNTHHSAPEEAFDCVVIIRGGGATADLSGFDTLALAENVAQFPLPIITGIGHDRDESVLDMVSFMRVKTPTAAAQFLISHAEETLRRIEDCQSRLLYHVQNRMAMETLRMARLSERIPPLFALVKTRQEARLDRLLQSLTTTIGQRVEQQKNRLELLSTRLPAIAAQRLMKERHQLELLQQRAQALDPTLLLKRGYSITLHQGRLLKNADKLQPGDELETRLAEGTVRSVVTASCPPIENEEKNRIQ